MRKRGLHCKRTVLTVEGRRAVQGSWAPFRQHLAGIMAAAVGPGALTPPDRCLSPGRFRESASGVECDVCVTTRGCDFKGSVMRLCHQVQPSLAPLIRLVGWGLRWCWDKSMPVRWVGAGSPSAWWVVGVVGVR